MEPLWSGKSLRSLRKPALQIQTEATGFYSTRVHVCRKQGVVFVDQVRVLVHRCGVALQHVAEMSPRAGGGRSPAKRDQALCSDSLAN